MITFPPRLLFQVILREKNKPILIERTSFKHAVIISFYYGREDDSDFYALAMELHDLLNGHEIGFYDGHELEMLDNRDGTYYMYGRNAEELFKFVRPVLAKYDFIYGAAVCLRFGEIIEEPSRIEFEFE